MSVLPLISPFAPVPAGYVPDADCAECHRDIARSYAAVAMARSMSAPAANNVIEDFTSERNTFFHAPSNRHYQMTQRGDDFFVTRFQLHPETHQRINVFTQRIDAVIGSGDHSRGYLYRTPSGELFEFPIAWYTQTQHWGMAPGYDHASHDDFTRPITRACIACHNAYPAFTPRSDLLGQPHVFPEQLPQGIGCQRCHGPGEAHVRIARDPGAADAEIKSSILNIATLAPQQQDDVCLQCHLQPSSRFTSFLRLPGQGDFSHSPRNPLDHHVLYFDNGSPDERAARFEINHHPYRLRQSACWIESKGALTCITCHDPHTKTPPAHAAATYNPKCLTCHQPADCSDSHTTTSSPPDPNASPDCIACHMPKRRTQDVIHIVMTDHKIQRKPPLDLLAPLAEQPLNPSQLPVLYQHTAPPHTPHPFAPMASLLAAVNDQNFAHLPALEAALQSNPAAHTSFEPWLILGTAQLHLLRSEQAAASLHRAVDLARDQPLPLANLGLAVLPSDPREAERHLRRALQRTMGSVETLYNLAIIVASDRRLNEAENYYRQAIGIGPNHARSHFNLGNLRARAGSIEAAIPHFQRALEIDPAFLEAARNLGVAFRRTNHWPAAVSTWQAARVFHPDDPGLIEELILAAVTSPDPAAHNTAAAHALAQKLRALSPADARPVLFEALIHLAAGENDQARSRLASLHHNAATALNPVDALALRAMQALTAPTPATSTAWQAIETERAALRQSDRLLESILNLGRDRLTSNDE